VRHTDGIDPAVLDVPASMAGRRIHVVEDGPASGRDRPEQVRELER
jgi:hypothetical protein